MKRKWGAVGAGVFLLAGACLLWKRDASFLIDEAFIRAPICQVRADSSGRLSALLCEPGKWVEAGETLFTLNASQEQLHQQELQAKIGELHERLSFCLIQAEEAMQEFLNARTDLAIGLEDRSEEPLAKLQEQQSLAERYRQEIALEQGVFEKIQKEIEHKKALSPCSGFIVSCQRQEGERIEMGDAVYSICNPNTMWVEGIVPESMVSKISLKQKVVASLLSEKKCSWKGEITWIAPTALEDGRGVVIRVSFSEKLPQFLKPNLKVRLKVHEAAV